MKKLFLIVAVAIFSLGTVNAFAQETTTPATEETAVVEETVVDEVPASDTQLAEAKPMHQVLMQKFLEGGWEWMLPVLLCLVFGLAIDLAFVEWVGIGYGAQTYDNPGGVLQCSIEVDSHIFSP